MEVKEIVAGLIAEFHNGVITSDEGIQFQLKYWSNTNSSVIFDAIPLDKDVTGKWVFKFLIPRGESQEITLNQVFAGSPGLAVGRYFWKGISEFLRAVAEGYFMPKFARRDLFSCLDDNLDIEDVRNLFRGACRGLYRIHSMGMIHNDVKLENIFVDGELNGFLADLGTTHELDKSSGTTNRVHATWQYMAPEMARAILKVGNYDFDAKADVWALGYCLYIILTGSYIFDGSCDRDLNYEFLWDLAKRQDSGLQEEIASEMRIQDIDDTAIDFVCRCMMIDPEQRMTIEECCEHPFLSLQYATKVQIGRSLPGDHGEDSPVL